MNIIRLTINQVSKAWDRDRIRYGIFEAFAPETVPDSDMLQSILCQLLKEEMQCWRIYDDEGKVYGHIITTITTDLNKKNLLIYSEHAFYRFPNREAYVDVNDKLEQFAKANGCQRVIGYSSNPVAISLAEKLGYSSDHRVLMKEV